MSIITCILTELNAKKRNITKNRSHIRSLVIGFDLKYGRIRDILIKSTALRLSSVWHHQLIQASNQNLRKLRSLKLREHQGRNVHVSQTKDLVMMTVYSIDRKADIPFQSSKCSGNLWATGGSFYSILSQIRSAESPWWTKSALTPVPRKQAARGNHLNSSVAERCGTFVRCFVLADLWIIFAADQEPQNGESPRPSVTFHLNLETICDFPSEPRKEIDSSIQGR